MVVKAGRGGVIETYSTFISPHVSFDLGLNVTGEWKYKTNEPGNSVSSCYRQVLLPHMEARFEFEFLIF